MAGDLPQHRRPAIDRRLHGARDALSERRRHVRCGAGQSLTATPSLRAKRSNPVCLRGEPLDCVVARAPRNDELTNRSW
ncbi:hypothetical protein DCG74_21315 [Bradyrhizobium sp. WBAH42]|nr:hypothetical protein DCG74_21315 [Bradyrhizobium sp. WBAH42]